MSRFFGPMRPYSMALPARLPPQEKRALSLVHSARTSEARVVGDSASCISETTLISETFVSAAEEAGESSNVRASQTPQLPSEPRLPVTSPKEQVSLGSGAERPLTEADHEDGILVVQARVGDSAAFEALYRRHAPYALALAVRVQGHAQDIEDIVHDAFLKVHDHLEELRSDTSFRPWLARIVVSLVRTRMRRRKFLGALGFGADEPIELDALVTCDASPEVRAQLAQIYALLRQAPIDQSICWVLRYVEGRKLEDVAKIAGCSLATAKRRIAQVQERLLLGDYRLRLDLEDDHAH